MAYRERELRAATAPAPQPMLNTVRWGSVWSGVAIGLGFMALFSSLWLAFGYGSDISWFRNNIDWWLGGTGIAALFVAGIVAGYVSGVRGTLAGFLNSCTAWGLLTAVGGVIGLGIADATLDLSTNSLNGIAAQIPTDDLWIAFYAIVIGLAASTLGGILGGGMHKVTEYPMTVTRDAYPVGREVVRDSDRTEVYDDAGRHRRI